MHSFDKSVQDCVSYNKNKQDATHEMTTYSENSPNATKDGYKTHHHTKIFSQVINFNDYIFVIFFKYELSKHFNKYV